MNRHDPPKITQRNLAKQAASPQLKTAASGGTRPPGSGLPPGTQPGYPPPTNTLTPIYNRAAKAWHAPPEIKSMVSKQQINAMKTMISKRAPHLELKPKGMPLRPPKPARDHYLSQSIAAMQTVLAAQKNKARASFAKATMSGTAKRSFNRAARRM